MCRTVQAEVREAACESERREDGRIGLFGPQPSGTKQSVMSGRGHKHEFPDR